MTYLQNFCVNIYKFLYIYKLVNSDKQLHLYLDYVTAMLLGQDSKKFSPFLHSFKL